MNGIFCPSLSRSIPIQYYDIFVIDYLGGILKTLSNISNLAVSLSRYQVINKKFKKLSFLDHKFKIFFITIFILIIHSDKLLTFRINSNYVTNLNFNDYVEFPVRNTFTGLFEKDPNLNQRIGIKYKTKNPFYFVLFCLNFVLNDFLLLLVLFVIDILILAIFKKSIESKNKIT